MKDYAAIATGYARQVLAGEIPAGRWVKLACKRHLDDLARAEQGWEYVFNPELQDAAGKRYRPADRICAFAEHMPHVKGDWAARGELIRLGAWQVFFLASIFGWVHRVTGKRRFRRADLIVPRKNAKSTIAAVIGLYMLAADGEHGAEVYSGATSLKQANEVFGPAQRMAAVSPDYCAFYGVHPGTLRVSVSETNSKFEPLIGNPGDGASPSCSITDEYHEHKTSSQYDTMTTGMGARSQPLALMITTAGSNIGGPCYQHQAALQKVLEGVREDDARFGIIYGIDPEDDWTDPAVLRKANPNYDVSVAGDFLLKAQVDAVHDPRKQAVFKTKHLDVWVNAASPWINLHAFQQLADPELREEDFRGETCHDGTDLASKNDIASKAKLFRRRIDGVWHYYLFTRNWLPQAAVQKPENEHYRGWVEQGHIVQTSGNMIDLPLIQADVQADAELHIVAEVAMDAWGSREIAPALQQDGFTVVDVPMTTRNLSEPMKAIAALIDAGRFHHDGNPATVWMFSNVEVHEDHNANIFPRKAAPHLKIDAAVAAILAMSRSMLGATEGRSFWETASA